MPESNLRYASALFVRWSSRAMRCWSSGLLRSMSLAVLLSGGVAFAAPVTINGAEIELPGACKLAEGAVVCNAEGQQLEIWISRTPLGPGVQPTDTFMRRLSRFSEIHNAAVNSITRSTGNDTVSSFDNYGSYSALGALITSKAETGKPVVRFASIMHSGEVWQVLEAVAKRTPAVESLAGEVQRSFKLPTPASEAPEATADSAGKGKPEPAAAAPNPATAPPPPGPAASSNTFIATLFSLQYPLYLQVDVVENAVDSVLVKFRRRSHGGGPNVTISLRNIRDSDKPANIVAAQKAASNASMAGATQSVDVNTFGALSGAGFALVGTPDTKKGLSGIESLESYFVAEIDGRRLEVRMTAERAYAADAQATWAMLGNTFKLLN